MNNRNLDKASELWRDYQYERYMDDDEDDRILAYLEEHDEEYEMARELIKSGWWHYPMWELDSVVYEGDLDEIREEYAAYLESKEEEAASKEQ